MDIGLKNLYENRRLFTGRKKIFFLIANESICQAIAHRKRKNNPAAPILPDCLRHAPRFQGLFGRFSVAPLLLHFLLRTVEKTIQSKKKADISTQTNRILKLNIFN
jgi:hypothetical protein